MKKHGIFTASPPHKQKRKIGSVQHRLPYKPKRRRLQVAAKPVVCVDGQGDASEAGGQGKESKADGQGHESKADSQGNDAEAGDESEGNDAGGGDEGDALGAGDEQEDLDQPGSDPDSSDSDSSQEAQGGGLGRQARTDAQIDSILGQVFATDLGPEADRITVAHVAVSLLQVMKEHRASYNLMDSIFSLVTQLVTPPPEASSWKRIRSLLKCSQAPVTSYQRCSRDCSVTRVEDADGDCKNGHPLRAERVHVAALRPQVKCFAGTHTWAEITAAVTHHTINSAGSSAFCCIKCSPRYREKVLSACPPGVVTIPILMGSDGLPLTHGKFGANHPVWLNTMRNLAVSKGSRVQEWVGSLLGGPTLPPSLRTSLGPVRSELATLCNQPFPCADKNGEVRECRVVLLGVSGDGQGIKKLSGSTWNGQWSCPTCQMPFKTFLSRSVTPDFRVFLPQGDALRTDARFGTPCTLPRPELKTHAWHERQAARVHDANQARRPGQRARHSQGPALTF